MVEEGEGVVRKPVICDLRDRKGAAAHIGSGEQISFALRYRLYRVDAMNMFARGRIVAEDLRLP
jgi:hypothetical protein